MSAEGLLVAFMVVAIAALVVGGTLVERTRAVAKRECYIANAHRSTADVIAICGSKP